MRSPRIAGFLFSCLTTPPKQLRVFTNPFAGLQSGFAILQTHFAGLQSGFADLQTPSRACKMASRIYKPISRACKVASRFYKPISRPREPLSRFREAFQEAFKRPSKVAKEKGSLLSHPYLYTRFPNGDD